MEIVKSSGVRRNFPHPRHLLLKSKNQQKIFFIFRTKNCPCGQFLVLGKRSSSSHELMDFDRAAAPER